MLFMCWVRMPNHVAVIEKTGTTIPIVQSSAAYKQRAVRVKVSVSLRAVTVPG